MRFRKYDDPSKSYSIGELLDEIGSGSALVMDSYYRTWSISRLEPGDDAIEGTVPDIPYKTNFITPVGVMKKKG